MSITFSNFQNQAWEDKVNLELNSYLENKTGDHIPKVQGIHSFYETQHIGGVLFQKHKNHIWLDGIFVISAFRRQGVGTQLISQVVDYAKQYSIDTILLNTYFSQAKEFFSCCQFEEIGSIPNWKYSLTCYFMKRTV